MKSPTKNQNNNLAIGLNWCDLMLHVCNHGIGNNTNKEPNKARTPNNLSGIDLKTV